MVVLCTTGCWVFSWVFRNFEKNRLRWTPKLKKNNVYASEWADLGLGHRSTFDWRRSPSRQYASCERSDPHCSHAECRLKKSRNFYQQVWMTECLEILRNFPKLRLTLKVESLFAFIMTSKNRTEIYILFENRFEIYICILFKNRTKHFKTL